VDIKAYLLAKSPELWYFSNIEKKLSLFKLKYNLLIISKKRRLWDIQKNTEDEEK
tara:strand:+ start:268 stop:432 length:165 start_codon:yes stop_codon:yes gene_type:complete